MANYYFLATALPPLLLGTAPELDFKEFVYMLKCNLTQSDWKKITALRRYYDILNILSFWKEEDLVIYGNFSEVELEDALISGLGLPDYVYRYMDEYESVAERIKHFSKLLSVYFDEEIPLFSGFVKKYLKVERDTRLIFTSFRARRLGKDLLQELQFEDPEDEIVAQIIAQKDAAVYEPPEEYIELKSLFEKHHEQPFELYQALIEYKFHKIEDIVGYDMFSIDRVLGYMVRLILIEEWFAMDKKKGLGILDHIVKEAS